MVVQMRKPLVSLLSGLHAPKYQPTFADNSNIHQNYRYVTINLADPHVSFMVMPNICGMGVYFESTIARRAIKFWDAGMRTGTFIAGDA